MLITVNGSLATIADHGIWLRSSLVLLRAYGSLIGNAGLPIWLANLVALITEIGSLLFMLIYSTDYTATPLVEKSCDFSSPSCPNNAIA